MDYKRIIPNREVRLKILEVLDFVPDKWMVNLQYLIKTGRKLNLRNPKRYSEKIQWYKLYYRDPLMTKCADKYTARDYIKAKGYEDILAPLHGVYNYASEINFDKLPDKFVLKISNSSHKNIICKNKSNLDIYKTKLQLEKWKNKKKKGLEWVYHNSKPRIICEEFLNDPNNDLIDYKFFCFQGAVAYVFVISQRNSEKDIKSGVYSRDFNLLPYKRIGFNDIDKAMEKPINYNRMLKIAESLSKDFPHVRVDLYNIYGKIYFGELTFYPYSGYDEFEPDEFDYILGKEFILP